MNEKRMERFLAYIFIGLVIIAVAGPMLVSLASALVPLIAVAGVVALVLRVVWYYTNRY